MGFLDHEQLGLLISGAVLILAGLGGGWYSRGADSSKGDSNQSILRVVILILGIVMLVCGLADLLLDAVER